MTPSRRELDDAVLLEQILKIRASHEFATTYGSPRVWLELRRQGVRVGRKRVERLMRGHGLQGAHLRRGWRGGSQSSSGASARRSGRSVMPSSTPRARRAARLLPASRSALRATASAIGMPF